MWKWFLGLAIAACVVVAAGYSGAVRTPVVRRAQVSLPGWPAGARPLRIALLSDLHVAGPDMPPSRLARIIEQVNAQKPDLVLVAGDVVGDRSLSSRHYSNAESVAPLTALRAPLGVIAVLGNHDWWRDGPAMRRTLQAAGITVLANSAVRRGPLTIAGADDVHTGHADPAALDRAAARLPGPVVVLSHSPDVAPRLSDRFPLVLAGHTHCGQVVLPLIGPLATASHYGRRYACGEIREGARTVIVAGGLGTSVLPMRLGAMPDWWLVTVGP